MTGDDLELWGGAECTVNRVGDRFRDQLRATGHHDRLSDLALIAGLGIRTLRFPILWERVAPRPDGVCDWAWSDARIAELARLNIRPIVGLLHHGSGPVHTSLLDDAFPQLFARYAAAVAQRYPHVRDWTPINEPVTTARFATLYGTWYPHAADLALFWRAMVVQTEATVAAMRAIRQVNPHARLVQTDDLGEATSDDRTRTVAEYYNDRRWLGWDLLAGRVRPGHPLWAEGARCGMASRLDAIADDPCPADVIGIDHYPTSDRHLTALNDGIGFADEPALRTSPAVPGGLATALRQAWARYGTPLAVTECHLGCTREEQVRWLRREWDTALAARAEGVDVRAVTLWALFGASDWDSLLTREVGSYESGAFDVRGGVVRPTAVARLAAALGGVKDCPSAIDALSRQPGWWEHDARFGAVPDSLEAHGTAPVILITAGTGSLPEAFAGACRLRGLGHALIDRAGLERELAEGRAWAVVDAAGWLAEDGAMAQRCAAQGVHLTLVRDREGLPSVPKGALLVHTGDLFSPYDTDNHATAIERTLASGAIVSAPGDRLISPTFTPDLVRVVLDLVIDGESGEWHLTSAVLTPLAFARRLAEALTLDPARVVEAEAVLEGESETEPRRGDGMLPPLTAAIRDYAAARQAG